MVFMQSWDKTHFAMIALQNLLTPDPSCCQCLQNIAWLLSFIASENFGKNILELYFIP